MELIWRYLCVIISLKSLSCEGDNDVVLNGTLNNISTSLARIARKQQEIDARIDSIAANMKKSGEDTNEELFILKRAIASEKVYVRNLVESMNVDIGGRIASEKEYSRNLVESMSVDIGGRISSIKATSIDLGGRIQSIENGITVIEATSDNLGGRVATVEATSDTLGDRIAAVEKTSDGLGGRIQSIEKGITAVEATSDDIRTRVDTMETSTASLVSAAASGLCESHPCLNDGVCTGTESGYKCDCHKGYAGEQCEDGGTIEVYESSEINFAQFETNQKKLYEHYYHPMNNLKFSVRTERDAHILLQTSADDFETSKTNYAVLLDGWGGTRTVIAHDRHERLDISGLLSAYEYRDFWVSWNGTTISVGKGDTIGSEVIISYVDKLKLMEIKGVSFGTAWFTSADWKFPKGLNECDIEPCGHCKACIDGIYNYTCIA